MTPDRTHSSWILAAVGGVFALIAQITLILMGSA
jgi:hypothetical protein